METYIPGLLRRCVKDLLQMQRGRLSPPQSWGDRVVMSIQYDVHQRRVFTSVAPMLFAGFADRDRLCFECRLALPNKHLSWAAPHSMSQISQFSGFCSYHQLERSINENFYWRSPTTASASGGAAAPSRVWGAAARTHCSRARARTSSPPARMATAGNRRP
jgi:hypothetical protein